MSNRVIAMVEGLSSARTLEEFSRALEPVLELSEEERMTYLCLSNYSEFPGGLSDAETGTVREILRSWEKQSSLVRLGVVLLCQRFVDRWIDDELNFRDPVISTARRS